MFLIFSCCTKSFLRISCSFISLYKYYIYSMRDVEFCMADVLFIWESCNYFGSSFLSSKGVLWKRIFHRTFCVCTEKNETFISVLIKHQGFFVIFQVKKNARYLLFFRSILGSNNLMVMQHSFAPPTSALYIYLLAIGSPSAVLKYAASLCTSFISQRIKQLCIPSSKCYIQLNIHLNPLSQPAGDEHI